MALLDEIKPILGISGTLKDSEIMGLIEAAKMDLKTTTAITSTLIDEATDPLIKRAIIVYCQSSYIWDDVAISNNFMNSYNLIKNSLSLSGTYTGGTT